MNNLTNKYSSVVIWCCSCFYSASIVFDIFSLVMVTWICVILKHRRHYLFFSFFLFLFHFFVFFLFFFFFFFFKNMVMVISAMLRCYIITQANGNITGSAIYVPRPWCGSCWRRCLCRRRRSHSRSLVSALCLSKWTDEFWPKRGYQQGLFSAP